MRRLLVVGARGIPDVEGGAEKNAEQLFPRLVAAGYAVHLMGLAKHVREPEYRGVKLIASPGSRLFGTDKLLYYLHAVWTTARLRPDIVHLQGLGAAIFLIAYKCLARKVVVRYGSRDYAIAKWGPIGKLGFRLSEWQLRFADAVIAVSPSIAQHLSAALHRDRIHVIPNAVDALPDRVVCGALEMPPTSGRPYLLMVGRINAGKNVHLVMSAHQKLCRTFRQAGKLPPKLLIVGGVDDIAYQAKLEQLQTEDVEFLGRISRTALVPIYQGASGFINASTHEGSCNAILEAISFGAPVLLSDIPENRDLGLPELHYISIQCEKQIVEALTSMIREPRQFQVDGGFLPSWEEIAGRTMEVYQKIGETPPTREADGKRHGRNQIEIAN